MKIIKHLLNYTGLFAVIAFVLAAVYFRAEFFSDRINKPIDTALSEIGNSLGVKIPAYKHEENSPLEHQSQELAEINEPEQALNNDMDSETEMSDESTSETSPDTGMVVTITESVAETVDSLFSSDKNKIQIGEDNADISREETTSNDTNIVMDAIEEITGVVNSFNENESPDPRETLVRARKAFWNGDLQEAEKAYQELAEHEELNPNVYGELGNVYYAQGKWQEAGKAYYEAAVRLIEIKQPYQVNYLLRVIKGLDSESAEKLKQKMSG